MSFRSLRTRCGLLFAAAVVCPPVRANDSSVVVGAGGLVLTKTEAITMEKETLEVGMDEIIVRYEFRNLTAHAITTRVAFPIPEFVYEEGRDYNMNLESDNPFDFKLVVDGHPRPFETERILKDNRLGYTHHWIQEFPAGRLTKVEHRYRPAVGFEFWLSRRDQRDHPEYLGEMRRNYCADTKRVDRNALWDDTIPAMSNSLHYILTTANNWHGPIGEFTLIIHPPPHDPILYTCFKGLRKTANGDYRLHRRRFKPDRELRLLFVTLNGRKSQTIQHESSAPH